MKEKIVELSKKWWFWVIIVVLILICFASGDPNEQEKESNNQQDYQIQQSEVVTFLEGTNSDDFADILENVTGIENIEGNIIGNSINYSKNNNKYSINIDANKDTKEIDYVRVICLTDEDETNVLMAFNRMDYKSENDAEFTNWLIENIGKESSKKIGDANFYLSLSTSNHPILEMKTDGSDDYMFDNTNNK